MLSMCFHHETEKEEESASPRKVPAVMELKGRVPAMRPGETNTWRPRRTVSALEEGGLGE